MRMMIAELNKKQQARSTIYANIIIGAVRPGYLSAKLNPRIDQLINLLTGKGYERVIIVWLKLFKNRQNNKGEILNDTISKQ